jgi:hypothetical protein
MGHRHLDGPDMTTMSTAERLDRFINAARRLSADAGHYDDGTPRRRYRIYLIRTCDGWTPVMAPAHHRPPTERRRDW